MIRATSPRCFQPRPCSRALLAGVMLFAGTMGTAAATIIGTSVDNGDGTYTYSYEVDNTDGAFDVAVWSLEFAFAPPDWDQLDAFSGGDVSVPNDWFAGVGVPFAGLSAQDFVSLDSGGDVLVGDILAGFSFTSSYQPGLVDWAEFASAGDSASGRTIGPVFVHAVPEPGGGLLWVGAGALMLLLTPRRRSPVSIRGCTRSAPLLPVAEDMA